MCEPTEWDHDISLPNNQPITISHMRSPMSCFSACSHGRPPGHVSPLQHSVSVSQALSSLSAGTILGWSLSPGCIKLSGMFVNISTVVSKAAWVAQWLRVQQLGTLDPRFGCLVLCPDPGPYSSFLLIKLLGGSMWCLNGLSHSCLCGKLGWRSRLLSSAWPCPGCCRHLEGKTADINTLSLLLSLK